MPSPLALVIVAEHPARTIGFTRVADDIAQELLARGVAVTYVGFFSDHAPRAQPPPYPIVAVDHPREAAAAVASIADSTTAAPVESLLIGRVPELITYEERLRELGSRDRVRVTFYEAVDFAPAPASLELLMDRLDRLIPATVRAEHLLHHVGNVDPAIPHAVATDTFAPLSTADRNRVRAATFDIDDDRPLVGTFSRNSENKRFDLAARTIAHLVHGSHARCTRCAATTVAPLGLDGRLGRTPASCRRCGADVVAAEPIDLVWQLHTEDVDRAGRAASGGWNLDMLIERYGLADVLWWQRHLPVGGGIPIAELAERMAACDLHLLLSDCGGWELTMLETAACGVANVVADAGAFGEYVAPFAKVVPVVDRYWAGHGHRGEGDIGAAVAAVSELISHPAERIALAEEGRRCANDFTAAKVGRLWHDRLRRWASVT